MKAPVLVVAAWSPELRALREARSSDDDESVVLREIGVGLVDAAIGTARALGELRPRAVILVGTAGRFPGGPLAPHDVVLAQKLILLAPETIAGRAFLPAPMTDTMETFPALRRALATRFPMPRVTVACPLAITKSAATARTIERALGRKSAPPLVENLEAFAVARAAGEAGIPFAAVLGIANTVGPRGHVEWKKHGAAAAAGACAAVAAYLAAGARA